MSTPLAAPAPGGIAVGSLTQAHKHGRKHEAILTLQDIRTRMGEHLFFPGGKDGHLDRLTIACEDFDLDDRGVIVATPSQVEQILSFGRKHVDHALLVHCMHGIGRSTAATLAILADRLGAAHEAEAVARLFAMRPEARPNFVIVGRADHALGRNGDLVSALSAHEAADPSAPIQRRNRLAFYEKNREIYAHI